MSMMQKVDVVGLVDADDGAAEEEVSPATEDCIVVMSLGPSENGSCAYDVGQYELVPMIVDHEESISYSPTAPFGYATPLESATNGGVSYVRQGVYEILECSTRRDEFAATENSTNMIKFLRRVSDMDLPSMISPINTSFESDASDCYIVESEPDIAPNKNCEGFSPIVPFISVGVPHAALIAQLKQIEKKNNYYFVSDYIDDVLNHLRFSEQKRKRIMFRSMQSHARWNLVYFLIDLAESFEFVRSTLHLAVYVLDCFMDMYWIRGDKLNLVAIACIRIASKLEETEKDRPKFQEINDSMYQIYTIFEYKNVEAKVIRAMDFDFIVPTIASYADYYQPHLFTREEYNESLCVQDNISLLPNYEYVKRSTIKTYNKLIHMSLYNQQMVLERPSLLISACIAAARHLQGIFPEWSDHLTFLTTYSMNYLWQQKGLLLQMYNFAEEQQKLL